MEKKDTKKTVLHIVNAAAILTLLIVLFTVDIDAFENQWDSLVVFKRNIRWIEGLVESFSPLFIFILIIIFTVWSVSKFSVSVSGVSIAGIDISLKDTDKVVKSNIRNFLNTKRSLFCLKPNYDNFADVFSSYHSIYDFLRSQLHLYDSEDNNKSIVYDEVQNMLSKLNQFLAKYQSDYRRWYEKKNDEEFIFLDVLQPQYGKYEELVEEFKKINLYMQEKSKIFGINMLEWEESEGEMENITKDNQL